MLGLGDLGVYLSLRFCCCGVWFHYVGVSECAFLPIFWLLSPLLAF